MQAAHRSTVCIYTFAESKIQLLSVERHAVGALLGFGIGLMSTDHNLLQRAIILCATVILALIYGALDATVCTAGMIHRYILL